MEKAERELSENKETRTKKLTLLAERIVQDKNIPNARRDDAFLLRFLRAKKFDVDKSFRMVLIEKNSYSPHGSGFANLSSNHIFSIFRQIQKYFKMKNDSSDLFRVSPLSDMQELLKMQIQQVLPHRDSNGSVIYIFRVRKYSYSFGFLEWIQFLSICMLHYNFRELWSVQMAGRKGVPKQYNGTRKCNSWSAYSNRWFSCSAWYGRCSISTRQISVSTFGEAKRWSYSRFISNAFQSISHFAWAILFWRRFGNNEAIYDRKDSKSGNVAFELDYSFATIIYLFFTFV